MSDENHIDYQVILNSIDDFILLIDIDEKIVKVFNPEINTPLFILNENLLSKSLKEVFPVELLDELKLNIKKSDDGNKAISFDFCFQLGEVSFWYSIKHTLYYNKKELQGSLIFIRDITPRKDAEENYRRIFENAVMGIYQSTDGEGKHLSANPALASIYGYDSVDDLIQSVSSISKQLFVHPDRRKEFIDGLTNYGECENFESQVYKKNGEIIWISENARTVKSDAGQIQFIVGTVKDITERKDTEEKLKLAKEDWEATFDSIDDIIAILDIDRKIVRMNKTATNTIFVDDLQNMAYSCRDIFNCSNSFCDTCPVKLTSEKQKTFSSEVENSRIGKTFLLRTSPKYDVKNNFTGIVLVAKDITEEKRLQQESEYRLQQIIQADKLKSLGEMVASVAHEINNPNSYIIYNVSLLQDSYKELVNLFEKAKDCKVQDTETFDLIMNEMVELTDSIKKGTKRIQNVVTNVKDFARLDDGKMLEININDVINKSLEIIGSKIRRNVEHFEVNLSDRIPDLPGQFQKLEQVIINILDNSINSFEDRKGSSLIISTQFIKRIKSILIEIEDNGRGIEENTVSKIFEPFFTTRRDIGGTGLGLSVSYEIINKHNGRIAVLSKPGIGSKFTIFLPLGSEPVDMQPKILCVDDGPEIYNLLRISFLEETDKFISVITEPANLLAYIGDHPEVDVVVLNMKIGELGWRLIDRIKENYPLMEILIYSHDLRFNKEKPKGIKLLGNNLDVNELKSMLNSIARLKI